MTSNKLVIVGTAAVDLIIPSASTSVSGRRRHPPTFVRPGGGCRNIAALTAAGGLDVTLYSVVGNDEWAGWLEDVTLRWNVNCRFFQQLGTRTPIFIAFLGEDGEILDGKMFPGGCFEEFNTELGQRVLQEIPPDCEFVLISTDVQRSLLETVSQRGPGRKTVLAFTSSPDPNLVSWLELCDYAFLNIKQLALLAGSDLDGLQGSEVPELVRLAARTSTNLICSAGKQGTWFVDCTGKEVGWHPALACRVRSALGAGDALVAGVILGLYQGESLNRAVAMGVKKAASVLACIGPVPRKQPHASGRSSK